LIIKSATLCDALARPGDVVRDNRKAKRCQFLRTNNEKKIRGGYKSSLPAKKTISAEYRIQHSTVKKTRIDSILTAISLLVIARIEASFFACQSGQSHRTLNHCFRTWSGLVLPARNGRISISDDDGTRSSFLTFFNNVMNIIAQRGKKASCSVVNQIGRFCLVVSSFYR